MEMRNGPGENYSPRPENKEKNFLQNHPENNKITPEIQKVVDSVLDILEKNPETSEKITQNFDNLLKEIIQNPETLQLLDGKILQNMQNKLNSLKENFLNGKISGEEAKNL